MNAIDILLTNIDATILGYVQGSFGNLTPIVSILWTSMFIVFIAFYGYKVIISGKFLLSDLWIHCFKIIAIFILATQWNAFSIFILDVVTNMPSDIAGQMISAAATGPSDVTSANTALGLFYEKSMTVATTVSQGAGWNISVIISSWAIRLCALALTAYALMLIVLSKIAVAVLLAAGPVFILMLIFMQTRSLFEGWLRTLLNYALIPVFVYGILALLLALLVQPLAILEANASVSAQVMTYIAPFMLISVVSVLLLAQVMNLSSGIAGGLSLSTMGLGRIAGRSAQHGATTGVNYGRIQAERGIARITKTGKHSPENKLRSAVAAPKPQGRKP
ncbi:MAG: type IV secretion system protein [Alphaproteobacteria bacterium]|nr:type IV secretion system protein [Alphaproteobacteria bacterium]